MKSNQVDVSCLGLLSEIRKAWVEHSLCEVMMTNPLLHIEILGLKIILVRGCENVAGKLMQRS